MRVSPEQLNLSSRRRKKENFIHKMDYPHYNFVERLLSTVSIQTVFITFLSVGSTLGFYYTDTVFELDMGIVGIAIIYPLVFNINSAFQRRESALQHLSRIQSNVYSIRLAHYHFLEGVLLNTGGPEEIDFILKKLLTLMSEYFKSDDFTEKDYLLILEQFSAVSWSIETNLRGKGVPAPNISRVNESLRSTFQEFELLRNIKIYRTPLALRAYTRFFVSIFPVLYGPLFAYIAKENDALWGALVLCVLYTLVLLGLDAIQDGLEEPFDGLGIDDIHFEQYPVHVQLPVVTPGKNRLSLDKKGKALLVEDMDGQEVEVREASMLSRESHSATRRNSKNKIHTFKLGSNLSTGSLAELEAKS